MISHQRLSQRDFFSVELLLLAFFLRGALTVGFGFVAAANPECPPPALGVGAVPRRAPLTIRPYLLAPHCPLRLPRLGGARPCEYSALGAALSVPCHIRALGHVGGVACRVPDAYRGGPGHRRRAAVYRVRRWTVSYQGGEGMSAVAIWGADAPRASLEAVRVYRSGASDRGGHRTAPYLSRHQHATPGRVPPAWG
jgi:hypothetical protein